MNYIEPNAQKESSNNLENQFQQNSIRPVSYDILNSINNLGNQIGYNNKLLLANVTEIVKRNEVLSRKRKKTKSCEQLLVSEDKPICIQSFYDDGSTEIAKLTLNLSGKFQVYSLDFGGREKTEKFGLYFENEVVWIIGDKKAVRGNYLLQCFIRSGVEFNPAISEKRASAVLNRFWSFKIAQEGTRLSIQTMPGWDRGKFYHRDNFLFQKNVDFPDIPVFEKMFPSVTLTGSSRELYFKELNRIKGWQERFLIALYPFIGLLRTLLNEGHVPLKKVLNFVMLESFDRNQFPIWMQIFNRRTLQCISLDLSDREIKKIMQDAKDELLIFDATTYPEDTNYKRQKLAQNAVKIIDTVIGKKNFYNITDGWNNNAAVIISQDRILENSAVNIFVDSNFIEKSDVQLEFKDSQVMESVFSGVVTFVQENMASVQQMIRKKRESHRDEYKIFDIIFDILQDFWKGEGINMKEELNLPESWNAGELFRCNLCEGEDELAMLLEAVRKGMRKFKVREKKYGVNYEEKAIYYDNDFLYFPTPIMRAIIDENGLYSHFSELLLCLRNNGEMKTDTEGLSRKIQVGDRRFEVYQIRRKFLSPLGSVDIVSLGKEV